MAYYITQGTYLYFDGGGKGDSGFTSVATNNEWTIMGLPGFLEMGEIALNGAGGSYDKIEVTCLSDRKHEYVDGLIADNDSDKEITFKFLYHPVLFGAIKTLMDAEETGNAGVTDDIRTYNSWRVRLPDGSTFNINGDIGSVTLDSVGTNDKLTFTMVVAVHDVEYTAIIN